MIPEDLVGKQLPDGILPESPAWTCLSRGKFLKASGGPRRALSRDLEMNCPIILAKTQVHPLCGVGTEGAHVFRDTRHHADGRPKPQSCGAGQPARSIDL